LKTKGLVPQTSDGIDPVWRIDLE